MITCSSIGYNGSLANQIFQFASTWGISRTLGYGVRFPAENFTSGNPHDYSGGKLRECFDIPNTLFAPGSEIIRSLSYVYNERCFSYDEGTRSIPDGSDLRGYFQSELYFKEHETELRKILRFRPDVVDRANSLYKINPDSTCIHVRRGDYLSSSNHHPSQNVEYYQKAIKHIDGGTFYVFSDDIGWCRENLNSLDNNLVFLEIMDPYVSLFLMSQCKNHIIANSSFSWWGAWLGKKEDQIVLSPSTWFGPSLSMNNTKDLYCEGWNKI